MLVASRYVVGGSYHMPWLRSILSRGLNWLYRVGLSLDLRDLSNARRMYKTGILKNLDLTGNDYDVLMEALLKFMARGGRVAEMPWHFELETQIQADGVPWRLVSSSLATFLLRSDK